MDCKVCTKCEESKEPSQFTKGKVICKACIYTLYTRPSNLRRLAKQGRLPKDQHPRKTSEELYETKKRAWEKQNAKNKGSTPPPFKAPKIPMAPKPPVIRLEQLLSPEEYKAHKLAAKRKYRKENPEKHAAQRKRDYSKAKNKPEVKIAKNIRKRLKEFMKPGTRLGTFSGMVGSTKDELLKHLESHFEQGMNWDNYGLTGWHIDHVKPLAAFDLTDSTTWTQINHYTNLKPMWGNQNQDKSSYWMGVKWAKGKMVTDNSGT